MKIAKYTNFLPAIVLLLTSAAHGRDPVLSKFGNSHATDAVYTADGTKVVVADALGATTWDVATRQPLSFTPIRIDGPV